MDETFTIKQISERTGLSIPTLRYYEDIGLIDPVDRLENGHRRYTQHDINRIELIKRLKMTGMPISQMQHFTALYREGVSTTPQRRQMMEQHREKIRAQMEALCETLAVIEQKIETYREQEESIIYE